MYYASTLKNLLSPIGTSLVLPVAVSHFSLHPFQVGLGLPPIIWGTGSPLPEYLGHQETASPL